MKKIVKYGLIGLALVSASALVGLVFLEADRWGDRRQAAYNEKCQLTAKCMQLAAGEDGVLDFNEGLELARSFGYKKPLFINENVIIELSGVGPKDTKLKIGYNLDSGRSRDSIEITWDQMRNYIKRQESR